jgi:glycosyltransferase involved in cell wall biosynthesis
MESAALGKPVVASQVRGNVEAVKDGITGLLVPVLNAPALAEAITALLRKPDRAAAMGQRARQRAMTHFDERRFFWKTDREYRRLLRDRLSIDPSPLLKPIPSTRVQRSGEPI